MTKDIFQKAMAMALLGGISETLPNSWKSSKAQNIVNNIKNSDEGVIWTATHLTKMWLRWSSQTWRTFIPCKLSLSVCTPIQWEIHLRANLDHLYCIVEWQIRGTYIVAHRTKLTLHCPIWSYYFPPLYFPVYLKSFYYIGLRAGTQVKSIFYYEYTLAGGEQGLYL